MRVLTEYAKKLKANGVTCEVAVIKGACHGFYTMPGEYHFTCTYTTSLLIAADSTYQLTVLLLF